MNRRDFIRAGGAIAITPGLAALLAACGDGKDDTEAKPTGGETGATTKTSVVPRKVKIGFVALTDCASIIMAEKLGYFAERDLEVTIEKQANWPATRDNLLNGQIDAAHCLVNAPAAEIESRLLGRYKLGPGLPDKTYTGNQMQFFRDGKVNLPRRSHAVWFMAQYQRFGLLKEPPPYMQIADSVILKDLWEHRDKRPGQISGGMQQRTAVARAFAVAPRLLLLDEPFGALDALTRAQLQQQLVELWGHESETETVMMVTHGIDEAILLADRIVVMANPPGPSVLDIIPVAIDRPRDRVSIVDHPAFRDVQTRLMALLANEATAAA